jgi:hypothetical protein
MLNHSMIFAKKIILQPYRKAKDITPLYNERSTLLTSSPSSYLPLISAFVTSCRNSISVCLSSIISSRSLINSFSFMPLVNMRRNVFLFQCYVQLNTSVFQYLLHQPSSSDVLQILYICCSWPL